MHEVFVRHGYDFQWFDQKLNGINARKRFREDNTPSVRDLTMNDTRKASDALEDRVGTQRGVTEERAGAPPEEERQKKR